MLLLRGRQVNVLLSDIVLYEQGAKDLHHRESLPYCQVKRTLHLLGHSAY